MESDLPQFQGQSMSSHILLKGLQHWKLPLLLNFRSMVIWVVISTLISSHRHGPPRMTCLKPLFSYKHFTYEPKAILPKKKKKKGDYSQGTF